MKSIKHEGVASCPPARLFNLINSIEQYPSFLSWCKEAKITSRNPTSIRATVFVHKYGISFHCPFTYTLRSNNEIVVGLPSGGPFNAVSGLWRFERFNEDTKFSFELKLDYQSTWWIDFFLIPILRGEVKKLIKAFEQRA